MKVKINVLKKHIVKGKCGHRNKCAVALAVLDAGLKGVIVNREDLSFDYTHNKLTYRYYDINLPIRVSSFIDKFDDLKGKPSERKKLKPFSFNLRFQEVK